MNRRLSVRTLAYAVALAAALHQSASAQLCTQQTFLGNNPDEGDPGWNEEAQGLAHDHDYWYITQNPAFVTAPGGQILGGPQLWRIPVTHDLGSGVDCNHGGVSCKRLFNTALFAQGYNHYGDPDYFEFEGHGYVVVPIESHGGDGLPAMAFFRADETLELVALATVPDQNGSGWVAVDPDGVLTSSNSPLTTIFNRFSLNWATLESATPAPILTSESPVVLQDETGTALEVEHPQGGDYSDAGELLYFSNGFIGGSGPSWGVHVFRMRPGSGADCGGPPLCVIARQIERSHNGPGGFAFEFTSGGVTQEETEGLTLWDLDADGRAPGLRGQLHVILLDNDVLTADDVYVKHYRTTFADSLAPEISCPGNAVAECSAHGGVPGADGQLASFLTGAHALDFCDEHPSVTNNGPPFFGLGTSNVTFTATDHAGNAASCLAQVLVQDTTPPAIVCPAPVSVECTSPTGIGAADSQLTSFFAGVAAPDKCDATPFISNNAPGLLPFGVTEVTFTAADHSLNARSCASTVTVGDTTPPRLSLEVRPAVLGPPNHKMIPITATVVVTDRCDPAVTIELLSISSNEPDDGLGDGDTPFDVQDGQVGTADTTFSLRAERSGGGSGRVYTITYRARDAAGNQSTATAQVTVPRN